MEHGSYRLVYWTSAGDPGGRVLGPDTCDVGRDPSCEIVVRDFAVSLRHARFTLDHQGVWVEDLRSKCGTQVNGRPVVRELLVPGDRVRLAKFELILLEGPPDLEADMAVLETLDSTLRASTAPLAAAPAVSVGDRRCLRCKTVPLTTLEPCRPQISFFECPSCGRQYALQPGRELTFKWLHPISLALYPVIFDLAPAARATAVAAWDVERRPREQIEAFVSEIRLELVEPTQQVRDILGCRTSEQELRDYLGLYVEHIERLLADRWRAGDPD
jgi:hypothetical protein